ncbi:MAG TPA: hypothetical protein VE991_12645 [Acidimicrobiales bacterium]|nr:hypothetical protein [Acidimicrobiales bacterium]
MSETEADRSPQAPGAPGAGTRPTGIGRRVTALLGQALASDDAESGGLRADDVLADPEGATVVLGAPDSWDSARNAVVQRYGRVGALLVVGHEDRWARAHGDQPATPAPVEFLLDHFTELDAPAIDGLLAELERGEGMDVADEDTSSRRWLHATYAVAERDGSDEAHRQYMAAFDRVMRRAGALLAS